MAALQEGNVYWKTDGSDALHSNMSVCVCGGGGGAALLK